MQTMWQDGLRRVLKGQTTMEEILRVIAVDQM
jgi:type II secretory ATPase GspE/PulE/Tfp pilus assembly ATPase PilB-like protein